jgi:hypothetical protein
MEESKKNYYLGPLVNKKNLLTGTEKKLKPGQRFYVDRE